MTRGSFVKRSIIMIFITGLLSANVLGNLRICALRVSFQEDNLSSTTGNGQFLLESNGIECSEYTLDPPPHDRSYFESQLVAISSYFDSVSYGQFKIDLDDSEVFPSSSEGAYELSKFMNYYNPYSDSNLQEKRLTELFRDAIVLADSLDQISFESYDLVVVFHAGIGQDFSLPFLDPTPEDIPSTYVDQTMLQEHLGTSSIIIDGIQITKGVLLPESQNHLLFSIAESMFSDASEPCEYQYGLTGTFALMVGFAVGLPPLWNIETGESGVGIFGLMDQGSNNGRGVVPSPPTAWTRIYAGWEDPLDIPLGSMVTLSSQQKDQIAKLPVSENEYFLIENRNNTIQNRVSIDSIRFKMGQDNGGSLYPPYIEILQDSAGIKKDENGVVVSVPNYDIGLPASGLLIWHIDETIIYNKINEYSINNDLSHLGVDLEEADGAQDIGYVSSFIFNDPSAGYFGDMWFKGNSQYFLANPNMVDLSPEFGPNTYPSTTMHDGSSSNLRVSNISESGEAMSFTVSNSLISPGFSDTSLGLISIYDIDGDGDNDIVGGTDSLFIGLVDSVIDRTYFHELSSDDFRVIVQDQESHTLLDVFEYFTDSVHHYRYDYFIPSNSVSLLYDEGIDSLFFPVLTNGSAGIDRKSKSEWESHSKRVFADPNNFGIDLSSSGISIDVFGNPTFKWTSNTFNYICGIDLDLDAKGDVLALDNDGSLYAFNSDLVLMAGFPLNIQVQQPVLARDLYGSEYPEIVARSADSSSIYIVNYQGHILNRIANMKHDDLVSLSVIKEKNSIITRSTIYQLGQLSDPKGNEWGFLNSDQGSSRKLDLNYIFNDQGSSILNRSYVYPNPILDGLAKIRVESISASYINVYVYDLAGYFIKEFNSDLFQEGTQISEWSWNVSGLEPGIYFAHVEVGSDNKKDTQIVKVAILE